jgi:tetratricopeptide (TPR) repeat protein
LFAYATSGELDEAQSTLTRALEHFQRSGDLYGEAEALLRLGGIFRAAGRVEDAIARLERSLALFRESDNRRGEARALVSLGRAYREAGHESEARAALDTGKALSDQLGDDWVTPEATSR